MAARERPFEILRVRDDRLPLTWRTTGVGPPSGLVAGVGARQSRAPPQSLVAKDVESLKLRKGGLAMDAKRLLRPGIGLLALTLVLAIGIVLGQQTPPTETKGIKITPVAVVDLGPEIPGMQGRQLRVRIATVEPGGVLGVHDHKDRPEILYVLKGTVVDHRGSEAKEYHAGGSWTAALGVTHWFENKGKTPAVLIAADIFKQQ